MPFVQPSNPHNRGNQGNATVIHVPPGGVILPDQTAVAKAVIDYVAAHGCDGSKQLHDLTLLFQVETNALVQQDKNRGVVGELFLPVDGNLTGPTLASIQSWAGQLNVPFNGCKAMAPPPPVHTGGTGPQQQPGGAQTTSSSNLPLYIGLGLVGVTAVVMIAMASGGKKKRGKR